MNPENLEKLNTFSANHHTKGRACFSWCGDFAVQILSYRINHISPVMHMARFGKLLKLHFLLQVASDQVSSSLRVAKGALVQAVDPSSNAAKAGLQGTRRTLSGISVGMSIKVFFASFVNSSSP